MFHTFFTDKATSFTLGKALPRKSDAALRKNILFLISMVLGNA
jgi:hypothetical protein